MFGGSSGSTALVAPPAWIAQCGSVVKKDALSRPGAEEDTYAATSRFSSFASLGGKIRPRGGGGVASPHALWADGGGHGGAGAGTRGRDARRPRHPSSFPVVQCDPGYKCVSRVRDFMFQHEDKRLEVRMQALAEARKKAKIRHNTVMPTIQQIREEYIALPSYQKDSMHFDPAELVKEEAGGGLLFEAGCPVEGKKSYSGMGWNKVVWVLRAKSLGESARRHPSGGQ